MAFDTQRTPIGPVKFPEKYTAEVNQNNFISIQNLPTELKSALKHYSEEAANWRYRKGSWTIPQLVHHIFDSHLNAYCRTKFTLTETDPVIKPYDENLWADLADAKSLDLQHSLVLIEHLHARWCICLKDLKPEQWQRRYFHPDLQRYFTLEEMLHLYAWHGRHHVSQIVAAFERKITE